MKTLTSNILNMYVKIWKKIIEVEKTLIIILFYINMWLLNIYIAKLIK